MSVVVLFGPVAALFGSVSTEKTGAIVKRYGLSWVRESSQIILCDVEAAIPKEILDATGVIPL
ncbi:hypothetical protein JCM18750_21370 [Halostagnicola bangensis]